MTVLVPEFLQTKTYPAQNTRATLADMAIQAGAISAASFKVNASGSVGLFVDVLAGSAWVKGSVSARQGLYHCVNDGTMTLPISSNSSGNPRIDQVVLHVYDTLDGGDAQDAAYVEVLTGTPTGGADLNNRSGAATLPNNCLRLGDVLVDNLTTSIGTSKIRDRRTWARGFYDGNVLTSGTSTGFTTTPSNLANPAIRVECTGNPVEVTITTEFTQSSSNGMVAQPFIDGVAANNPSNYDAGPIFFSGGSGTCHATWLVRAPAAGSRLFTAGIGNGSATGTLTLNHSPRYTRIWVKELVGSPISNGLN